MKKYPQSLFARTIATRLTAANTIIDTPCGSGITTYILAQKFPAAKVIGSDLSAKNIAVARRKYSADNLDFRVEDIHNLVAEIGKIDAFCLINSLFLLPRPADLLRNISQKITADGRLFLILPNPASTNFKRYQRIFPEVNTFILDPKDYTDFFIETGFEIIYNEGIARVPIYGRRDTKLLFPIRDEYLFWLEKRSKSQDFGYFMLELKKQSHP